MEHNSSINPRNDVRRSKVFNVGWLLSFETPTGPFSYDMVSDDKAAENKFLKLFRQEEKRLSELSADKAILMSKPFAVKAAIVNKVLTKNKSDNLLWQAGVAVDGHVTENGKFRPQRAAPIALLFIAGLFALACPRQAIADENNMPYANGCAGYANFTLARELPMLKDKHLSHAEIAQWINSHPRYQAKQKELFDDCIKKHGRVDNK